MYSQLQRDNAKYRHIDKRCCTVTAGINTESKHLILSYDDQWLVYIQ